MPKLKYYIYTVLVAILIATPIILLCYFAYTTVTNATLSSKAIYFNALFIFASSWWNTLMNKANELKKYESSLSPIHESFLKLNIESLSKTLWAIIYFNFAGIVTTFLSLIWGDLTVISFSILSLYFLIVSFLLLLLSAPFKSRIENANVLLAKREKEEKKKEEIIKSLKSGLDKFEKNKNFENYNTVISINSENAGQTQ